ncbi:MAG TPA: glycosyltransferase [Gaiellaceae bacterium]
MSAAPATSPAPVRLHEVEIAAPFPPLPDPGAPYERALSLVRLHSVPLGLAELDLRGGLSPAAYAGRVWQALAPEIAAHLRADALPVPDRLTAEGLAALAEPPCQEARRRVLAEPPLVSVVVPTRDAGELLEPCLASLRDCDYPADRREVIVVDNVRRSSATADFLQCAFPWVRYVREESPGSASARNRGLAEARGTIVAFLDDDTVVDRFWLAEVAKGFALAPRVGCVTQLILPLELETPAQIWFEEYGGAAKGFAQRLYDLGEHRPDDPLFPFNAGRFGSGGGMAFDRAALVRLGGFDPALGNGTPARGGVDLEAFLRTVVEGYTLVYEPAAIVRHRHLREYADLRGRVYAYGVGLTALILRSLLAKPSLLPAFLARLPRGLVFALSSSSAKHAGKSPTYPGELRRAELRGMLGGPLAYVRSARRFGWPARVGPGA